MPSLANGLQQVQNSFSAETTLSTRWRELASQQRDLGADPQARTLEWCADRLEEQLQAWESQPLTLEEASQESGYSRDHLGRLLSEGTIPNSGEPYTPRIRRRDLPRKPGHQIGHPSATVEEDVPSRMQVARSVVNSD